MNQDITPDELAEIIDKIRNKKDEEQEDISKYRYAIYVRKSTDDPKRQARSLPDQILECRRIAKERHLVIPPNSIFQESQSAKEPDIRPVFRKLIDAIKEGKYDGILSWHPDRLSRNMKEAGEIIDLIDSKIIKDLQFVSFYFENNSTGKMVLGITFVLAKSYSDQLSTNVLRGQKNRIEAGELKGNLVVHGYFKDKNSYLRPDGRNFQLIQEAWNMRIKGATQPVIADYLNKNNYEKAIGVGGRKHQPYRMDKTVVSNMLRDPIYAGVLVYGSQKSVNLNEFYDFVPMIEPTIFVQLNKEDKFNKILKQRMRGYRGEVKSDLMRGKVFCSECKKAMHTGLTPKNLKSGKTHYFYYRCDTEGCKLHNKSVRANMITDFVYKFLDENRFDSKELYEQCKLDANKMAESNHKLLDGQKKSLTRQITEQKEKIDSIKDFLIEEKEAGLKKEFRDDLKNETARLKETQDNLSEVEQAILANKELIIEYPKFLELYEVLPQIMRDNRHIKPQDFFIKKIFSNFYINKKSVSDFELNEPFKSMLKSQKVGGGRGARIRTENLLLPKQARYHYATPRHQYYCIIIPEI